MILQMHNNYHREQRTSQQNYDQNKRRCNDAASAQTPHGYRDVLRIREHPETECIREQEAGTTIGLRE